MGRPRETKGRRYWDYFLLFLVLQEVFVPYWTGIKVFDLFVTVVLTLTLLGRGIRIRHTPIIGAVAVIYFGLGLIQGIIWDFGIISAINSFILIFFQAYVIFLLFRENFFRKIEPIFLFLSLISFIFWIGINASDSIKSLHFALASAIAGPSQDSYERSILIFTHWAQIDDEAFGLSRFCGFFHEPGALAFFTVLMLTIRYSYVRRIDSRSIFYILMILASFSSAGYASLGIFGAGVIMSLKYTYLKYLIFLPLGLGLSYGYSQIEFLQSKIEKQVIEQQEMDLNEQTIGRIIGIRKAFYVISKYPLHGRGLITASQPKSKKHPEYVKYGWTSFISRIGLIAGIFYLFYFIRGYVKTLQRHGRLSPWFTFFSLIALFINLTSQAFIESIPMLLFFYYGSINTKQTWQARNY